MSAFCNNTLMESLNLIHLRKDTVETLMFNNRTENLFCETRLFSCHFRFILFVLYSQMKCVQYWPGEGTHQYGRVIVATRDIEIFSDFVIRIFEIEKVRFVVLGLHKSANVQFH